MAKREPDWDEWARVEVEIATNLRPEPGTEEWTATSLTANRLGEMIVELLSAKELQVGPFWRVRILSVERFPKKTIKGE